MTIDIKLNTSSFLSTSYPIISLYVIFSFKALLIPSPSAYFISYPYELDAAYDGSHDATVDS